METDNQAPVSLDSPVSPPRPPVPLAANSPHCNAPEDVESLQHIHLLCRVDDSGKSPRMEPAESTEELTKKPRIQGHEQEHCTPTRLGKGTKKKQNRRRKKTKKKGMDATGTSEEGILDLSKRAEEKGKEEEIKSEVPHIRSSTGKNHTERLRTMSTQTEGGPDRLKHKSTQTQAIKLENKHTQTDPVSSAKQGTKETPSTSVTGEQGAAPAHGVGNKDATGVDTQDTEPSSRSSDRGSRGSGDVKEGEQQLSGTRKRSGDGEEQRSGRSRSKSRVREKTSKEESNRTTKLTEKGNSRGSCEVSPAKQHSGPPMFTFHFYAVLDKKFKFNQDCDKLLLCLREGDFHVLQITHFVGMDQKDCLIEACFFVQENEVPRGRELFYKFQVQQRQKHILEVAERCIVIPYDQKELHLYEGHIDRNPELWNFRELLLSWVSSRKHQAHQSWITSAQILLDRVFQKWPSKIDQQGVSQFAKRLFSYKQSFETSSQRLTYPDSSTPPPVKVLNLIAEHLLKVLRTESSPLLLGLAVFQVCRSCNADLGVKGWAELCRLVSSETALSHQHLTEVKKVFTKSENTVIGLMNYCMRGLVAEVPLLLPLLHTLREPGEKAGTPNPEMPESAWAVLEGLEYATFREKIHRFSEKRRRMLALIEGQKQRAERWPLVWTSWLSLLNTEDIVEFSSRTGLAIEHVTQNLMYRLKEREKDQISDEMRKNKLQVVQNVLIYVLRKLQDDRERIIHSGYVSPLLTCCISIHRSVCGLARLVPLYKTVVMSYQVVLKVAEFQHFLLEKADKESSHELDLFFRNLSSVQDSLSQWRAGLLSNTLFTKSGALSYPNELELWDAFLKAECSVQQVSDQWRSMMERDLRYRISKASDVECVQLCCLVLSAEVLAAPHPVITVCLQELSQTSIKNICQDRTEKDLMVTLCEHAKSIPSSIISNILMESMARFKGDEVDCLLNPQSALHHLLRFWQDRQVDKEVEQMLQRGRVLLASLVGALCHGHIPLGQLQAILKHRQQFKQLFHQYKKWSGGQEVPDDVEKLLALREKEMCAFLQKTEYMNTLIKMVKKVENVIKVPEIAALERQLRAELQQVALSKLITVRDYMADDWNDTAAQGPLLWYAASKDVCIMAKEMHETQKSILVLSMWVEGAEVATTDQPRPCTMTLAQVLAMVWRQKIAAYRDLCQKLVLERVTLDELDSTLQRAGDRGEGAEMKKELDIMARMLQREAGTEPKWMVHCLHQIQQYLKVRQAAKTASVVLKIADLLELQGDFTPIISLMQLEQGSFRQQDLASLNNSIIKAERRLSKVTQDRTVCLQEFQKCWTLIAWVKANLQRMSDLKVFVDLASISAGENDSEVDRVACFHDAVTGYGSLIYSLPSTAGLEDFMHCAQPLWDALERDKKLPEKLRHSTDWLDWLKGLRETHGSVEQSSLSLASAINAMGVYYVGWPEDYVGRRTMESVLMVKVRKNNSDRSYDLTQLVELQNKLMLMSSKGDHGKEQVNRFMEVFDGVQRLGRVLVQLHSSGNMLFSHWQAHISCSSESGQCIQVKFPLPGKAFSYYGDVTEELQNLCRSLEFCHHDWGDLMAKARSQYHSLNYYTAEQIVYLCHWVFATCRNQASMPQSTWHLLSLIKPGCTLEEVRNAFALATRTAVTSETQLNASLTPINDEDFDQLPVLSSGFESVDHEENMHENIESPTEMNTELIEQEDAVQDTAMDITEIHNDSTKQDAPGMENIWKCFKADMPSYLGRNLDVLTLAQFLSCLAKMNRVQVRREMPVGLKEGRPNLVLCPMTDVLGTALAVYMHSPQQPLPTCDEVLLCQEETTAEQVELFLRRALGGRGPAEQGKIFTVINMGILAYDVSVSVGECFDRLQRCAGPHYRLVIVCPVNHQHKYVPSFFSSYKVQVGLGIIRERARQYLRDHFSTTGPHSRIYPEGISVWLISSTRPAVGKSLYVDKLFERLQCVEPGARLQRVRLLEARVQVDSFLKALNKQMRPVKEKAPILLHVDTAPVRFGLEEFLFQLLVLGCLSDSEGNQWRRNTSHLIAVELLRPYSTPQPQTQNEKVVQGFLDTLPTIHCRPPSEVKELEQNIRNKTARRSLDPLMNKQEFVSEGVQRPYQYLKRYKKRENLDTFKYEEGSIEGNPVDCLDHLLAYCGMTNPSWAELRNFTWFLNLQLKDCEYTAFCDPEFLAHHLQGFKGFVIKFMICMARDFATPSMDCSDQSPSFFSRNKSEDELLAVLTIRKKWESESHPYVFFNADHISLSFLGFCVQKCPLSNVLNAIDPQNNRVIMTNVMSDHLLQGLERQGISFSKDFDSLSREDKIQRISFVVGAKKGWIKGQFDPDPTYQLTTDNVMKMLAIHMRFRCGIPVIIMGETGCGKTRLVRFLCDLQREGKNTENMKLVKVHGGTTAEMIQQKVREAEALAERNQRQFGLDTILFFDEANTTESIFAIKEVLCDKTVQGHSLKKDSGLKIIAACNPYRRHSPEMVERLERAGLGYRVKAEETEDRLGSIPLRQLVYRVQPLPPSLISLIWDFGQLSDSAELSYIYQIVQKKAQGYSIPEQCFKVISDVLAESQRYMRSREDECSFVSLRDVERSMTVLLWFFTHSDKIFPNCVKHNSFHRTLKCLALAVGVCYYPSLVSREPYLTAISQYFPSPLNSAKLIEQEISSCQDLFLKNVQTRETIAKNIALKENVFLMVVCIELRIPLFLVGKPGSSKSLAKTVVADAMQGQNSRCKLFRALKAVHMVSFQCSPHSSPEGIIGTFRQCARFQQDKSPDKYVSVVVLDEIGLAEDSPQMPLKTLHPLLEDGCIDNDKPDHHMKVGFVGISNWALDPAKMNRGIFVSRWDPSENELVETAKGICCSDQSVLLKIQDLFPQLSKAFLKICKATGKSQFFGLRDFYSLVKMIFAVVRDSQQEPSNAQLAEAVLRNFSGQPNDFGPLSYFKEVFQNLTEIHPPTTIEMVERNLHHCNKEESRYLLLLTTNNAALYILQHRVFPKAQIAPEIVFGSGFPKDQEYASVCRNVNRVKTCMETGRTVILLNLQNLYESLYDALNQYYVYLGGQQYVDLGLGTHRVKCRVHKDFRLVVVEDQEKVYKQFPVPLINRLEKHQLDRSADLTLRQHRMLLKLKKWVKEFTCLSEEADDFTVLDTFVGFHDDACACALLQALETMDCQRRARNRLMDVNEDGEAEAMEMETSEEIQDKEVELSNTHSMSVDTGSPTPTLIDGHAVGEDKGHLPVLRSESEVSADEACLEDTTSRAQLATSHLEADESGNITEMNEGKEFIEAEEEEVFEAAKEILLNCATPDAVLRLKYSNLGSLERNLLQRMYFNEQHHLSLRDFLKRHMSKKWNHNRFIEVTTFSNLLTQSDIQALGVASHGLLLLSLHQFDTEASFSAKIRSFLRQKDVSPCILLIQTDMEESTCSNELIASAKYCTMNELNSLGSGQLCCYVVFITKLSRIACRSQYIGFQGGVWMSVHIDDLRDTQDMSPDISAFCGTPFSRLLCPSEVPGDHEEKAHQGQMVLSAQLHVVSLLRSCVQTAVGLLRDPDAWASRSMQRVQILLELLEGPNEGSRVRFRVVLLRRLAMVLAQREELMPSPGEWVNKEARKRQALQEGGTLRHTLWRCLQNMLTPVLARVLEVLDQDANLNLLHNAGVSDGLIHLWLDIVEDQQTLELAMPLNSSTVNEEIPVQHHLLVGGEEQPCHAPFSWLIRMLSQSLWEESEFLPDTQEDRGQRVLRFSNAFSTSGLGGHISKLSSVDAADFGERYLRDFVLLSFRVMSKEHLEVLIRAVQGCISELQHCMSVTPDLSPAWILAAVRLYAPRLGTLFHLLSLQPHLGGHLLQRTHKDTTEMYEDILALGVCVEDTVQQASTSLDRYESLLHRVQLLQPCVERAFGQNYSTLCSPGCVSKLKEIRSAWRGILIVTVFIQKVVLNMKKPRYKDLCLKSCIQLQRLMQMSSDLRIRSTLERVIDILNSCHESSSVLDFKYGTKCSVCLADLTEPVALPCGHTFCLSCLRNSIQDQRRFCPTCRVNLPSDFQPTVSHPLGSSLKLHRELRKCCNSFFLEVVSRFCFCEGDKPEDGVVELLFSLLITAQGSVYRTRDLSPFMECVDHSPVVRSVLPKLLLQHSFDEVKAHIQCYLQNLKDHVLDQEDLTELYLLFVNCFQDSLYSPGEGEAEKEQQQLLEATKFLSRLARKQIPEPQDNPTEFLLGVAWLRKCLGTAAQLLKRVVMSQDSLVEQEERFLQEVRAVFKYCTNDWHRVYLLRAVHQVTGLDYLQTLMHNASWNWIFPVKVLQLQDVMHSYVDHFLCCAQPYLVLRNAVGQALLESQADVLSSSLKNLDVPPAVTHVLLSLALYRQVTCHQVTDYQDLHPTEQSIAVLKDFLRALPVAHCDLCLGLLHNQVGGEGSPLRLTPEMPAQRRTLLEILVHAAAVFQSGGHLLTPLYRIASRPQSMTGAFLPTMPDDHTSEAAQWLVRERVQMYFCMNGHPCFVGECTKPTEVSRCADCKAPVGGLNHNPVEGFTMAHSVGDRTRTGHTLGEASRRSDAPERQLTMTASCVIRFCTHLAMLLGSVRHHQGISSMIQPPVQHVREFLWAHLERDMEVLGRSLGQNMEHTAIAMHLVLHAFLEHAADSQQQGEVLSSRQAREQWEQLICKSIINPVIKGLDTKLRRAQEQISADDNLSGSPLLGVLYGDPSSFLSVPPACPTNHSSFWNVSKMLTIEQFSQYLDQNQGRTLVPLLSLFIRKVQCIKQLCHLPNMAALQSDLLRMIPTVMKAGSSQTIGQVLQQIPTDPQKKVLLTRVKLFIKVWNELRMEMARSLELGVSEKLCRTELTMDSPREFLSLSRQGPGSCLGALIDFLSETHNSLVRQARQQSLQEDCDYSIPLEGVSETQLVLCHPEQELLPMLLAHCQYTLRKGKEMASSYDLLAIQSELARRFISGKPLIQADTAKYVKRQLQDFYMLLTEVRKKIPQESLKASVCAAMRTILRSFSDTCDAVFALEVALRFLAKVGGKPRDTLLGYLINTLRMKQQISRTVAKALGEIRLEHCASVWQVLTCWKSELMLCRDHDPFENLPAEYRKQLTSAEQKEVKTFLAVTDVHTLYQELHEILLLKTGNANPEQNFPAHWDIRSTLETHLEQKNMPALPGLDDLSDELTLDKGPEIWRLAVEFKR